MWHRVAGERHPRAAYRNHQVGRGVRGPRTLRRECGAVGSGARRGERGGGGARYLLQGAATQRLLRPSRSAGWALASPTTSRARALERKAFAASEQVIVDKSLYDWKEVEYEMVR